LLQVWYSASVNYVRWEDAISHPYRLLSGVRQGGCLSPVLFSIYVDRILIVLKRYGCELHGLSCSAIMYADDLVLIAPTINELQRMIHACCDELALLDLRINVRKSAGLRIGKHSRKTCCYIRANSNVIEWVNECKYLGIYIKNSSKFSCNFNTNKIKYYRAANAILGKLGHQDNAAATLHLLSSIAMPVLTYGIEALSLTKTQLIEIDHPWLRSCMKIFSTYDINIVRQCQSFADVMPVFHSYVIRCISFWNKLEFSNNSLLRLISNMYKTTNVTPFAQKYNCTADVFLTNYQQIVRNKFHEEAGLS
jgi:Reverse transcriptase (RNA-dependent DNA polymerase)